KKKFGEEIAYIVDGLTKLDKIFFYSLEEEQAENFRKMFLAMAKDLRIVIVKLADRLHNMKTLRHKNPANQIKTARETLEIFAPLANRLGIISLKWQLEDLAFYYLYPKEFKNVKELVALKREEREKYIDGFIEQVKKLLVKAEVKGKVTGRPKHFYSIYKKQKERNIETLYDLMGIRILVPALKECYEVLGVVHAAFKPIEGRFKDYIAMPRTNMYRSLHTTVIGPNGHPVEIQIRTYEMHDIAEYGVAAHWQYKEAREMTNVRHKDKMDFYWLRELIETQKQKDAPTAYMQNLKIDLFDDEVFVFTPKGAVHTMPIGATPIDFAYKVHTQIGHKCVGAKVNNKIVNLTYKLKSGDIVEILTSKKEAPKIDWINFLGTSFAKNKIKQWFRKQKHEQNLKGAKAEFEKKLLMIGILPKEVFNTEITKKFLANYNINTMEEFLLGVSYGELSIDGAIKILKNIFEEKDKKDDDLTLIEEVVSFKKKKISFDRVKVLGESGIEVYMAKCCNPLPGDSIIGYITMRRGISIHRKECLNLLNLKEENKERLVEVAWEANQKEELYPIVINIDAFERQGLLKDVINKIVENKTNMLEVDSKSNGGTAYVKLALQIKDIDHLNRIKNAIQSIGDVYSVHRVS
ncbi:bifunctional (p)ppGpp synthetase/guanosine-3',5'-bis(diphosphate) 3'-pyrophosphohydrolase, partial [bacterium]|nr:bifunctional (p)ppGpp synthetase/guanosine-3',5'-bis(diphosphate) 3'-pyrophosphohydrolase [bacterium]